MKIILFVLTVLTLGCRSNSPSTFSKSTAKTYVGEYSISKIDSVGNYNIFYAIKNDSTFKIISEKMYSNNCMPIRLNQTYYLTLHTALPDVRTAKGGTISVKSMGLVNCFDFDDQTQICYENDCVRDIFYSENIKGRCYIVK